jgi:hypothetical protein
MTRPNARPAPEPQRVRPYAMTGGRTRPTHDDLEIETLVSTISTGEQTPKLTVEQQAIGALCRDILSIAEVSAHLKLPLGVVRVLVGDMADEHLVIVHRQPTLATIPTWPCWNGCWTGCPPSDGGFGLPSRPC